MLKSRAYSLFLKHVFNSMLLEEFGRKKSTMSNLGFAGCRSLRNVLCLLPVELDFTFCFVYRWNLYRVKG